MSDDASRERDATDGDERGGAPDDETAARSPSESVRDSAQWDDSSTWSGSDGWSRSDSDASPTNPGPESDEHTPDSSTTAATDRDRIPLDLSSDSDSSGAESSGSDAEDADEDEDEDNPYEPEPRSAPIEAGDPDLENAVFVLLGVIAMVLVLLRLVSLPL